MDIVSEFLQLHILLIILPNQIELLKHVLIVIIIMTIPTMKSL